MSASTSFSRIGASLSPCSTRLELVAMPEARGADDAGSPQR
jgi:hypothetical protein